MKSQEQLLRGKDCMKDKNDTNQKSKNQKIKRNKNHDVNKMNLTLTFNLINLKK
jgi:hypothetical protein